MRKKIGNEVIDTETGEIIKGIMPFVKVYMSNLDSLVGLSSCGNNVLWYIITRVNYNSNIISFDLDGCVKFCKYKNRSNVYRGLNDLIERQIIFKHDKFYTINNKYFNRNGRK